MIVRWLPLEEVGAYVVATCLFSDPSTYGAFSTELAVPTMLPADVSVIDRSPVLQHCQAPVFVLNLYGAFPVLPVFEVLKDHVPSLFALDARTVTSCELPPTITEENTASVRGG